MKKDIIILNKKSNIAVCTLWSKKEDIIHKLPEDSRNKISIIGTLYSVPGINFMLQTLGETPQIDTLIVYGADLSDSGKALVKVFKEKDFSDLIIEPRLAEKIIFSIKFFDLREDYKKGNIKKLIQIIEENFKEDVKLVREKINIDLESALQTKSWSFPCVNYSIHETSLFAAWIKIIYLIMQYGYLKFSEYEENQKEIINLTVTIHLHGKKYSLEKEFEGVGISKDSFEKHVKEVLSPEIPPDVEYTYGSRLHNHPTGNNQIKLIIEKLAKSPYSRRAVAVTWYHEKDSKSKFPPCIVLVQGEISENEYHHTVYIRSNDMFRAWPVNMYGQILLAQKIVDEINRLSGTDYKLGTVTTISSSAHIYEHDFDSARKIIEKYSDFILRRFVNDQIGNFVIYKEDDKVIIEHRYSNEIINRWEFRDLESAYESLKKISLFLDPQHAFYLGKELARAFLDKKYVQK